MSNFKTISESNKFSQILKQGKKLVNDLFVLFYIENQLESPEFGVIASKKVGKAHERNRAKRLVREAIRLNINRFPLYSYVFVCRQKLSESNIEEVTSILLKSLAKIAN